MGVVESLIEPVVSEIEKIKERNRRVELNKEWETSLTRRIAIAASTYVLVVILLFSIGANKPFLNAIIPACAYFVSTLSMGVLKEWWIKRKNKF